MSNTKYKCFIKNCSSYLRTETCRMILELYNKIWINHIMIVNVSTPASDFKLMHVIEG
jgi:hypothetical protein